MTITVTEPVAQASITATSLPEHPDSVKKGTAQTLDCVKYILTYKESFLKVLTEDSIRCYLYAVSVTGYTSPAMNYVLLVRLGEITWGLRVYKGASGSSVTIYCSVWYGDHLDDGPLPSGGVEWVTGSVNTSTFPLSTRVQIVRDTENDIYYILAYDVDKGYTASANAVVIPFTDGEVAVLNLIGILTMNSKGDNDHGFIYINGLSSKCSCTTTVYFDKAVDNSPSGTSSTSLKYVSGVLIYPNPDSKSEDSVSKILVIDPGKLGRLAYSVVPQRGVRFNNYNYLHFSGGIIIPWTGDPESVFVGDV